MKINEKSKVYFYSINDGSSCYRRDFSAICLWRIEDLAYLFGANEVILPYALDYLHVLLTFGMIYVLENILSTFIRNDGNPNLAMAGLVVTAVLNIVFDYIFIFIFGWGVTGLCLSDYSFSDDWFPCIINPFL